MKRNYFLFEWLSGKEGINSTVSNKLLLMRTNEYDLVVYRWSATEFGRGYPEFRCEEVIRLRDRESREEKSIVYPLWGESWIEKLIKSKNRNRDLWNLELDICAREYANC